MTTALLASQGEDIGIECGYYVGEPRDIEELREFVDAIKANLSLSLKQLELLLSK